MLEHNTSRISFFFSFFWYIPRRESLFLFCPFLHAFLPHKRRKSKNRVFVCVWGGFSMFCCLGDFSVSFNRRTRPSTTHNRKPSSERIHRPKTGIDGTQEEDRDRLSLSVSLNIYTHKHFICKTYQPNFCLKGRNTQREIPRHWVGNNSVWIYTMHKTV